MVKGEYLMKMFIHSLLSVMSLICIFSIVINLYQGDSIGLIISIILFSIFGLSILQFFSEK